MEQLSGTIIKGYELRDRIGAGGFGAVYRAHQSTVGREVAIKIILPGFANRPEFVRRFEAEAQTVARLEHMNITPLYDFWRDPEGAYLVMRYLRGGSLQTALRDDPYDLESAARLLDQVASALAVAHRNHVIHRDIKPANILLDEDGNGYVADFGLAKDLDNSAVAYTQAGDVVGTPDYLSPEQVRSESVTPKSDIYSLGLVLYEMLTASHPFPEATPVERMFKQLNEAVPKITSLDQNTSDAINEVVQKATAKNPDQRYKDVLTLATAFREAAGLSVSQTAEKLVELLTPREQEVLKLIIDGKSNREIGDALTIELTTVKWYVTQIYRKLNVRSRVQAIVRARELDLIVDGHAAKDSGVSRISVLPEPENPYKGLQAFQIADEQDFFGREKLTQKLLSRLGQSGDYSRFLAVVGPSGSGKSSLVRAGLIPALWRGDLPGAEHWYITDFIPGAHPLDELEVALIQVAANRPDNLAEQLARDERGLVRAAQIILPDDGSELVIVIDQFEEVFTLVENEADRTHFLDLLHQAVIAPRSRVRLVITLRADFYDRPLQYPTFGELVRSRMETVLPLNAGELEQAIVGPAQRVGVRFEDGLVAAIVSDINYQPGALPLLQFALTELFEARENRILTRQGYEQIGRAAGALAKRAEQLYLELDEADREAVRQIFLRLVTLGEGSDDTRRRVARSELLAIAQDADLMDEVIDTYAAYRLLALDHDPITRSPTVEVAHEALIREWDRLRQWLNESRADIRLQRLLAAAAAEWLGADRDPGFLLHDSRLDQFEGWAAGTDVALTEKERAFLDASIEARQKRETDEAARLQRELETAQKLAEEAEARRLAEAQQAQEAQARAQEQSKSAQRLRWLAVGLAVFLLAAIAAAWFAFNQQAVAQRNAAESQNLALISGSQAALANGNTNEALALAMEAVKLNPNSSNAQRALSEAAYAPGTMRRFETPEGIVSSIEFSSDGQTALTSNWDQPEVWLRDMQTGEIIRRFEGHSEGTHDAVFMPDGQTALSAGEEGLLMLWDIETGEVIRQFEGHTEWIDNVALSPDGRTAVSGSGDNIPILWNIQTGEIIHRLGIQGEGHTAAAQAVAFSPDGRTVLSGSDDMTIILWDVSTGQVVRRFGANGEGHAAPLNAITLSPDGSQALSAAEETVILLWDVATGEVIRRFHGHTGWVWDLAFSSDGQHALSAGGDNSVILWDVATGQPISHLQGHENYIQSAAFNPDGRTASSGSGDNTMRVWDLEGGQFIRRLAGHTDWVFRAVRSPDGRQALTSSVDGTAILWDVETGEEIRRHTSDAPLPNAVLAPDGRMALLPTGFIIDEPYDAVLWDVETGQEIRRFTGHPDGVVSAAFSPDGQRAVTGGAMGTIILWDVASGQEIQRFEGYEADEFIGPSVATHSLAFSPDGQTLMSGFGNGTLVQWDVTSGQEIRQFEGHGFLVGQIVFSPDGQHIFTGAWDNTAIYWNAATGEIVHHFTDHSAAVYQVALTPDGRYGLGGSADNTTTLWDMETGEVIRRYSGPKADVFSIAFGPDGRDAVVTFFDGGVELWRIDTTVDDLVTWTKNNRYIPELTCTQRELYRIEPLCESEE